MQFLKWTSLETFARGSLKYLNPFVKNCARAGKNIRQRMDAFWEKRPAFFCGVFLLFGVHLAVENYSFADFLVFFFFPFLFSCKRFFFACAIIAISFFSTSFRVGLPAASSSYVGMASGYVLDRKQTCFHGKNGWAISFYLDQFTPDGQERSFGGFPLTIHTNAPSPLLGGFFYRFPARLVCDEKMVASVHLVSANRIESTKKMLWPVEYVLRTRRLLERILAHIYDDVSVRQIAGALTFGFFKDDAISDMMSRCGLEHILAVSGFHFGILAALILLLTQKILFFRRRKYSSFFCSIFFLTGYFFLIGPLPSVIRAYTGCVISLLGALLYRKVDSFQALGSGLIIAVFFDPLGTTSLGFELSYLSTLGIILFARPFEHFFRSIFSSKSLVEILQSNFFDKALRLVLKACMLPFSIVCAVSVLLIPYQLAFCSQFSSLGIIYNLFIPMLFSLAMPLVLISIFCYPIFFLSKIFAYCSSFPIALGLFFIQNVPILPYGIINGFSISQTVARIFIGTAICIGVLLEDKGYLEEPVVACL